MPSMPGPMELLVIAALALIVFGPARLPEIARSIGKAVSEFRRQAADLRAEFDLEMDEEDDRARPRPRSGEPERAKPALDPDPPAPGADAADGAGAEPTAPVEPAGEQPRDEG